MGAHRVPSAPLEQPASTETGPVHGLARNERCNWRDRRDRRKRCDGCDGCNGATGAIALLAHRKATLAPAGNNCECFCAQQMRHLIQQIIALLSERTVSVSMDDGTTINGYPGSLFPGN